MATAELFAHPDNPIPATGSSFLVMAEDGVALRVAQWRPTSRRGNRGTVLLMQGRAEFIERFFETVQELRRRGFHVLTFDWRGQGGSDRLLRNPRKGHVRRFSDYHRDLAAIFTGPMAALPQPHFALSHSMGAALALESSLKGAFKVERLVALAPMLELRMVEHPALAKLAATVLDWAGFGSAYIPGGGATSISTKPFAGNRLTCDEGRYARNAALAAAAPHLAIGDPTVRWVHEAFRFMQRMQPPNVPLGVHTPTLVIAAGQDPIVATPAVERFAARLKTGSALVLPGSRHEILMERDEVRDSFWAAFDAFIPGEMIALTDEPEGEGGA